MMASRAVVVAVCWALLVLCQTHSALYFYLESNDVKCLSEELPKDTMAVGRYRAEQFVPERNLYIENPSLGLRILVQREEGAVRVKDQRGASSGRFAFTADTPGVYSICLSTNNTGWFAHEKARVHFDLAVGDVGDDELQGGTAHEKLSELAMRVRDLNHRIADIRREQAYQRSREAEFRDKSEATNSKAVWWTLLQLVVLGVTCVWQVRHLRSFFEAKKLV